MKSALGPFAASPVMLVTTNAVIFPSVVRKKARVGVHMELMVIEYSPAGRTAESQRTSFCNRNLPWNAACAFAAAGNRQVGIEQPLALSLSPEFLWFSWDVSLY